MQGTGYTYIRIRAAGAEKRMLMAGTVFPGREIPKLTNEQREIAEVEEKIKGCRTGT